MRKHRHSQACCNDCGEHPHGSCYGCDRRRVNEAASKVPFVDAQHETCSDQQVLTLSQPIRVF